MTGFRLSTLLFFTLSILIFISTLSGCSGCKKQAGNELMRPSDLETVAEAEKKRIADSVANSEKDAADSERLAKEKAAKRAASLAKAQEQAKADSLAEVEARKRKIVTVGFNELEEGTTQLEDKVKPMIETARRRLNRNGYFSFSVEVAPSGKIIKFNLIHSDLDATDDNNIKTVAMTHRYPQYDPTKKKSYTTPVMKINF